MSTTILSLPNELKFRIVRSLAPFICEPFSFPVDVRKIEEDIETVFETKDLRMLATTCKGLRAFCKELLCRAVKLEYDGEHVLVKGSNPGSLPADFSNTFFLCLEAGAPKFPGEYELIEIDVTKITESYSECLMEFETKSHHRPLNARRLCLFPLEQVFQHFSSVTTLTLSDFPLSYPNLCALRHLRSLRTLCIQTPENRQEYIPDIGRLHSTFSLPRLSNLSIVVHSTDETDAISNVAKLFEKSITMLSIVGNNYADDEDTDFLAQILSNDVHTVKLVGLKHLNIDFVAFTARALREVISNSSCLESISLDCRGVPDFMPLFYVIDLIRLATREDFDTTLMIKADSSTSDDEDGQNGEDADDAMDDENDEGGMDTDDDFPYARDAPIWSAQVSKFFCTFTAVETAHGTRRVIDMLELYFACEDEHLSPINVDIRLGDLLEVFRSRVSTFRSLKRLVLATENTEPLESAESHAQLQDAVELLRRDCLPSAQRVTVRWGNIEQFSWTATAGQVVTSSEMDIDTLWSF